MTTSMKAEIRDAWADALESGEYPQVSGGLCAVTVSDEDGEQHIVGYCCLGVLSELAVKAGIIPAAEWPDGVGGTTDYLHYDGETGALSVAVAEWAGLDGDDTDPYLTDTATHRASQWNDGYEATFADIAAMVRNIPAA